MDPLKTFNYSSSFLDPTPLHYRSSSPNIIITNNNNNHINIIPTTTFDDISFSSYLKPPGNKNPNPNPNPQKKPHENSAIDDTEISIFDAQKYFSENNEAKYSKGGGAVVQLLQPSPDSNILSAATRVSSVSSTDGGYGRNFRTRSFNATPTASSEASWNSQTGLLANPPGSAGVSLGNFPNSDRKKRSSAKKWFSGRKCCCTGMKSVQVKEAASDSSEHGDSSTNGGKAKRDHPHKAAAAASTRSTSSITADIMEIGHHQKMGSPEDDFPAAEAPRQRRISATGRPFVDGFSFPILNNNNNNNTACSGAQVINNNTKKGMMSAKLLSPMEDPPRDSLEVYQPIPAVSRPPSMDIPAGSRAAHFNPGSPIAARVVASMDDDMESDASSDLFEIESFSTQTTSYPMYRRRDSLDEAPTFNARRFGGGNNNNSSIQYGRRSLDEPPTPSVAATECYAPSEVSIDWSVTTAEGYDRASVSNFSISASEMGSAAFLRQRLQHQAQEEVSTTTTAVGGGSGDNGKMRKGNGGLLMMSCRQEKAVNVGPQPMKWVPAAAAEGTQIFPLHVGGRPPRANKPPMGSDHSARLSLAFAA
ncbi:hypothetical protein ABFS83_10G147200 [Erythranthe nasuta]